MLGMAVEVSRKQSVPLMECTAYDDRYVAIIRRMEKDGEALLGLLRDINARKRRMIAVRKGK